jgi:phospholipid N-methyltransferase
MGVLGQVRKGINFALRPAGLEMRRLNAWTDDVRDFIPLAPTLAGAAKAGLTVGDYVDVTYNVAGATQSSIDQMAALGAFGGTIQSVCEIGPGSGRYLEKVKTLCKPAHYEIYETAGDWADWLVKTYGVVLQPTDGSTLAATPARSMDLVHAQKVLNTVPTLVALRYLDEMARVVRDGGKVVFDAMTEACMEEAVMERWFAGGVHHGSFPSMQPKQFIVDILKRRGLSLLGSFLVPTGPGSTECMVFQRKP